MEASPTITIRRADSSDIELLTAMRLEMRRERETAPLSIPADEFEASVRDFFRRTIADGSFISFLAFCNGEPAACSGLSIQPLPPSYSEPHGLRGYVTNMFTRRQWRGMGLATKLLDAIVTYCKSTGCDSIDLNASSAGRPVYLKYGFAELSGEMKLKL
ncbi:MAG: GNAT family N-acetyltransferase [Victivallales bacterium]|nr:GNAT family N-acetyltransferase [Victivallales bacterium]